MWKAREQQNEPAFVVVLSYNGTVMSPYCCDASVDALVSSGEGRKVGGTNNVEEG